MTDNFMLEKLLEKEGEDEGNESRENCFDDGNETNARVDFVHVDTAKAVKPDLLETKINQIGLALEKISLCNKSYDEFPYLADNGWVYCRVHAGHDWRDCRYRLPEDLNKRIFRCFHSAIMTVLYDIEDDQ